jgi:hypothetical protein
VPVEQGLAEEKEFHGGYRNTTFNIRSWLVGIQEHSTFYTNE